MLYKCVIGWQSTQHRKNRYLSTSQSTPPCCFKNEKPETNKTRGFSVFANMFSMVICMSLWTVKSHCSHMLGLQIMQWVVPLPHNDSGPFSLHPNLDEGGQFFFLLTRRSSISLPAENLQWEQIFHVLIQSCVLKTTFPFH